MKAEEWCQSPGCTRRAWGRGLCGVHLRRTGGTPVRAHGGTTLFPENHALLKEFGITYRQWNHWHREGWLTGGFKDVDRDRLKFLARAAQLKEMPLNELADLLATKELERL